PPALALIGLLGMLAGEQATRHFLHADDTAQKAPVTLSTGASS
ncbi:MAG TPA: XapX domain-containing protein, partial [Leclercia adecarboxylata]|nr:XapX domain-containing protein [Leclercia adecarboxylata]